MIHFREMIYEPIDCDEHPRLDGSALLPGVFLLIVWAMLAFWP
jgi:hypothetical protein